MSKYDPLGKYLAEQNGEKIPMSFGEIEKLLGFHLPHSSRYRAWWSNNPLNSVLTKVWLSAGYRTEAVDLDKGTLVFRKAETPVARDVNGNSEPSQGLRVIGCLEGALIINAEVDLTLPADPDWGHAN